MSLPKGRQCFLGLSVLTHWGRVTHICVGKLTIIDSGPVRRKMFPFDDVIIFPISSRFTTTSFLVAISFTLHRCLFFLPSTVPPNNAECNGLRNLMHLPFHCQLLFPKFKFLPFYRQFFPLQGHFLSHYRHLLPLHRNLFPLYHYFLPPHRQFFPLPYLRLLHQSRSFANTRGNFSHRRPLQDIHKTPVTLFTNMD